MHGCQQQAYHDTVVPLDCAYACMDGGESVTDKTPHLYVSLTWVCDALRSCNLSAKLALAT